jgi:WD40 repeat protein
VLWNVQDGTTRGPPLPAGPNGASRVTFSPDGRTLAAAGSSDELGGGAVRLWDVEHRTPAGAPLTTRFSGAMGSVGFSPDRRWLAGSAGRTVTLWDLSGPAPTGRRLATMPQGQGAFDVTFSADGRLLAVASSQGIVLWDLPGAVQDGEPLIRRDHEPVEVAFAGGDKGRRMLASSDLNGTVVLWDVTSRSPIGDPLPGHSDGNGKGGVAFRPDGRVLAAGGLSISLWDVDPSSWAARACRLVRPLAQAASPEFRPDQVPPDVCP